MKALFEITPLRALKDNYIWVIRYLPDNECVAIDPGEADVVIRYLKLLKAKLTGILITHQHWDHIGGVAKLQQDFPYVMVYSALDKTFSKQVKLVNEQARLVFWNKLSFDVLLVPGHTQKDVAFYTTSLNNQPAVFTGDTLFSAGCGKVFEGTLKQLYDSLLKLRNLPPETRVYCGHEYTLSNLKFAEYLEPSNCFIKAAINSVKLLYTKNLPSVPAMLGAECSINPFLRCDNKTFIEALPTKPNRPSFITAFERFAYVRQLKNEWHE